MRGGVGGEGWEEEVRKMQPTMQATKDCSSKLLECDGNIATVE